MFVNVSNRSVIEKYGNLLEHIKTDLEKALKKALLESDTKTFNLLSIKPDQEQQISQLMEKLGFDIDQIDKAKSCIFEIKIKSQQKNLLSAISRIVNYTRNEKISMSKLATNLKATLRYDLDFIKILAYVSSVMVDMTKMLDLYSYLTKNNIDNTVISTIIFEESDLEAYNVSIQHLQSLKEARNLI